MKKSALWSAGGRAFQADKMACATFSGVERSAGARAQRWRNHRWVVCVCACAHTHTAWKVPRKWLEMHQSPRAPVISSCGSWGQGWVKGARGKTAGKGGDFVNLESTGPHFRKLHSPSQLWPGGNTVRTSECSKEVWNVKFSWIPLIQGDSKTLWAKWNTFVSWVRQWADDWEPIHYW